ncbi:MAG: polyprenyl synthetase family protein [Myxococcota bacterium]
MIAHTAYPTVDPLWGLWSSDGLDQVEMRMLQLVEGTRVDRVGSMASEHLSTGGKRLRARLALAATEALGGHRSQAVGWAAAVELLHNATLVHDDLQDGDEVRRGAPTVWASHGMEQAINVGDLMLMLPYLAVEETQDPVIGFALTRCLARNAADIVRGQSEELSLLGTRRLDWGNYVAAAAGKTSGLFTLPVTGAALLAGRTPVVADALGAAFGRLGLVYQLVDDVIDLYGDKGRAQAGSDLYEGKVSALVAAHLGRAPEDAGWLVTLLETSRDQTSPADVTDAIGRFRRSGALSDVLRRIQSLVDETRETPALVAEPQLQAVAMGLASLATAPIGSLRHDA